MDRINVLANHLRASSEGNSSMLDPPRCTLRLSPVWPNHISWPLRNAAETHSIELHGTSLQLKALVCLQSQHTYLGGYSRTGSAAPISQQPTLATSSGTPYDNFPQAQTMANFPPAVHDLFNFDQLLTEDEKDIRYRTRAFMVLICPS